MEHLGQQQKAPWFARKGKTSGGGRQKYKIAFFLESVRKLVLELELSLVPESARELVQELELEQVRGLIQESELEFVREEKMEHPMEQQKGPRLARMGKTAAGGRRK